MTAPGQMLYSRDMDAWKAHLLLFKEVEAKNDQVFMAFSQATAAITAHFPATSIVIQKHNVLITDPLLVTSRDQFEALFTWLTLTFKPDQAKDYSVLSTLHGRQTMIATRLLLAMLPSLMRLWPL
jgi:hypothetical protein